MPLWTPYGHTHLSPRMIDFDPGKNTPSFSELAKDMRKIPISSEVHKNPMGAKMCMAKNKK